MSSSKTPVSNLLSLPVSQFQYRQMTPQVKQVVPAYVEPVVDENEEQLAAEVFANRIANERAQASAETEARLRHEYEVRAQQETARISKVIEQFEQTRKEYFSKVESEVVQLALSIAGKILHRESQVDPMLVAALVQIALSQLKEGSAATIRVCPAEAERWQQHFASLSLKLAVTVVGDAELTPEDCILETELGTVNFSLDMQLKEVQQGFFDVLAQKPQA
jgi:flagellar assembly protein FliH